LFRKHVDSTLKQVIFQGFPQITCPDLIPTAIGLEKWPSLLAILRTPPEAPSNSRTRAAPTATAIATETAPAIQAQIENKNLQPQQ